MAKEAVNAVGAGMKFMTEGKWLNRRAIPKIQREYVQKRQAGDNRANNDTQPYHECQSLHTFHREPDREGVESQSIF